MAATEIWHEESMSASPRAVYEALTDVHKLGQWWIPATQGESATGTTLEFRAEEFRQVMRVASLRTDELVQWQPTETGLPDWVGTEVEFALSPRDDRTVVRFRHSGFGDGIDRFPYYSMSWAIRLISLKALLEKGKGLPFPNEWDV
jgi:uncharacterized protein YndB with AHSA1/START domain